MTTNLTRSLREELFLYARRSVEVVRLGLNLDQVRELNLPPNPAKESDARFEPYVRATGCTDSWKLDALSPSFIDGLVENAIRNLVDEEAWREAEESEEVNKGRSTEIALDFDEEGER